MEFENLRGIDSDEVVKRRLERLRELQRPQPRKRDAVPLFA
jgi:hypothetical protein